MFGGCLWYSMLGGDPIAETTILRIGEEVDTVYSIVCAGIHLRTMKFLL